MGLGSLLEVCQVYGNVALEHGSKPTKNQLEGSYGDPVCELSGTRSGQNNYEGTSGSDLISTIRKHTSTLVDGSSVQEMYG